MIQINANDEFVSLAEQLSRSTVQVQGKRMEAGSGVIWQPDGLIITNAHVVSSSRATVQLSDGHSFEAQVTAVDRTRDLAALKVNATDLPSVTVGDSNTLRVGQLVLAVGNPLGLQSALTIGIIHALSSQKWVQADIQLAPGNSGGPLADAQGRVIGINTMIVNGLGFAVPSQAIERFLRQEERPYLGVTIQPVVVPLWHRRFFGLLVLEVAAGSLAQKAGLLTGDVLIGVGGQLFNSADDLASILSEAEPGEELQLNFWRGGQHRVCHIVVRGASEEAEAA